MPAANTDLVRNAAPNFATTLGSSITSSDTSMTLLSTTGLPTGTGITLTIDATNSSGVPTPATEETITGVVSGLDVIDLLRGKDGTTAQAHASGASITMWVTANLWNDFQTSYLTQHNQNGSHGNIVAGNLDFTGTFTAPVGSMSPTYITNPYRFNAYVSTTYTGSFGFSVIAFDTELFDPNSNYDTSTYTYTVPVTGIYTLYSQLALEIPTAPGSQSDSELEIVKNGSTIISNTFIIIDDISGTNQLQSWSAMYYGPLTAGDTIQTVAFTTTSENVYAGTVDQSAVTFMFGKFESHA